MKVRVALVDPAPATRQAIGSCLRAMEEVEVVAEAASLAGLVDFYLDFVPWLDVVVVDLQACDETGRRELDRLRRRFVGLRVILITRDTGPDYADAARRLAADEWLPKVRAASDLSDALRRAFSLAVMP